MMRALPSHNINNKRTRSQNQICISLPFPLRPNIFLVLIRGSHTFHCILTLLLIHTALVGNDLSENIIDLSRHIRGITANVEVRLLLEELVDLLCSLLEAVLDVDFLFLFTGEGGDDFELPGAVFGPLLGGVLVSEMRQRDG